MGANDAKEMLEVAKAECLRLERENTALRVQVVPQPNREALAKWLFEFRYPDHEGYWDAGHTPEFTKDQFRKKADELAALSPAPLTIDRESETELQECIEQEIELGGDGSSIIAAIREFLVRVGNSPEIPDSSPVEGEVTRTVWQKDQFYVTIETDAEGLVTISDELLVKLMTESGWVVQP